MTAASADRILCENYECPGYESQGDAFYAVVKAAHPDFNRKVDLCENCSDGHTDAVRK